MTSATETPPWFWSRLPVSLRAIVSGLAIGLIAANVWPFLLAHLGVLPAAAAEIAFFAVYLWWASGHGLPRATKLVRATAFRAGPLSTAQWAWGLVAALSIAASVHAAIVVLFRIVPFPVADFRQGYDLSAVPTLPLKWLVIIVSAASAGICEETGFRGYMQRPIELRHGPRIAILVSSLFFMLLHLNKGWAMAGMVPIVFGAGLLYGLLAWSAGSIIPGMIGHTAMDIGLFAYWWSGVAGTFHARTIGETGIDLPFEIACAVLGVAVVTALLAAWQLRRLRDG